MLAQHIPINVRVNALVFHSDCNFFITIWDHGSDDRNPHGLFLVWPVVKSGYNGEMAAEKNSSALSKKLLGNLLWSMKVDEASEAGKLCFWAHSSQVFDPLLLSLWVFTLTPLVLPLETPPLPNTRLFLRFDRIERSTCCVFLASKTNWLLTSDWSFGTELSGGDESEWSESKPCLQDLSKESSMSILNSCCTTPLFWSHP